MKKSFLLLITLFLLLSGINPLQAQEKKNVLKFIPLSLIVLTGNFHYERVFTEKMSLNVGVYHGGLKAALNADNTSQKYQFTWSGLTPELRFYLLGEGAPDGLYLGPYLRFRRIAVGWEQREEDPFGEPYISKVKLRFLSGGLGGVVGYQALVADIITFDTFLGLGYNLTSFKEVYNTGGTNHDLLDFSGFAIRPGFAIGVAF